MHPTHSPKLTQLQSTFLMMTIIIACHHQFNCSDFLIFKGPM